MLIFVRTWRRLLLYFCAVRLIVHLWYKYGFGILLQLPVDVRVVSAFAIIILDFVAHVLGPVRWVPHIWWRRWDHIR